MSIPLEMSFRNVAKSHARKDLIREKVAKLQQTHGRVLACRIAVERPHAHVCKGCPYRVRLNLRLPHGQEVVVTQEPGEGDTHERLETVIRSVFEVARRRMIEVVDKQRGAIKHRAFATHQEQ